MLDLIIIGGSAAGVTAAIYAARRKLNFKIISEDFGGEVAKSGEVDNWPGTPATNGVALAEAFGAHLKHYQVAAELGVRVESITRETKEYFTLGVKKQGATENYQAKAVIIATGMHPRKLAIPGEEEFTGKGVSYCTTCDGPLYKGKKVITIGGGNSGLESALMLANIAAQVTIMTIDRKFSGEEILSEKLRQLPNVQTIFNATALRIAGEKFVARLVYRDNQSAAEKSIPTQGIFVHIGNIPNSDLVPTGTAKNKWGEIEINLKGETNTPGLFAAGDVTNNPYKQIVVAAGQGAGAALAAIQYLNKSK